MQYYPFMLVHIGVLSTSHGISAVGSLLGNSFLIGTKSECKSCSETSQVQFRLYDFKFPSCVRKLCGLRLSNLGKVFPVLGEQRYSYV